MAKNVRIIRCSPEAVFAVLRDGWLYPTWVVGASRMRKQEADWPAVGTRLHHSFGVWPLVVDDVTTSMEWDPPRSLVIQPEGWPLGAARVALTVEPHARGCRVTMVEDAVSGPMTYVPGFLMQSLIWVRNREALRRLGWVATGRADR